ncbi:hypothetical protein K1X12_09925 [Hyphomonas sp. WL0036]|uniref:hypothetical protein n=1 Tax=Hyphomonas sediminis TaxID=2866160 RepID=UPI001C8208B6|nr:hypothetical protein [Hyphomonas sediminis]MBY9067217.1 hypothetical protein [Hyphomonas sediminis]
MTLARISATFILVLMASFLLTACSGGGAKGTVERLIQASERQADLLDSITTEKDLKRKKGKLREQAKVISKLSKEVQKHQRSGDFGKIMSKQPKLAKRFAAAAEKEQDAMMRFMARTDDAVFQEYMAIMRTAVP